MISTRDRQKAVELITESVQAGARAVEACKCLGIAFSSYLKWRQNPQSEDQRPKREFGPNSRALSEEERQAVYERYCLRLECPTGLSRPIGQRRVSGL